MNDVEKQERRRKLVKKLRTPVAQPPLENPELDNPEGDVEDLPGQEESFGAPDEMDSLYGDEETPTSQPLPVTGTASSTEGEDEPVSAVDEQAVLETTAPRRRKKKLPLSDRTV